MKVSSPAGVTRGTFAGENSISESLGTAVDGRGVGKSGSRGTRGKDQRRDYIIRLSCKLQNRLRTWANVALSRDHALHSNDNLGRFISLALGPSSHGILLGLGTPIRPHRRCDNRAQRLSGECYLSNTLKKWKRMQTLESFIDSCGLHTLCESETHVSVCLSKNLKISDCYS